MGVSTMGDSLNYCEEKKTFKKKLKEIRPKKKAKS
jgi:hypothetical protein